MMKRMFAAAVSLALLLSLFAVGASAAPAASLCADAVCVCAGETVDYSVFVNDCPGMAACVIRLQYDTEAFSLETDESTGEPYCRRGDLTAGGSFTCRETTTGCSVLWFHTENTAGSGTLFTVRLRASEDAANGEYPITVSCDGKNTIDMLGRTVELCGAEGTVCVRSFVPTFTAETVESRDNSEVEYAIRITDNPGIAGFRLYLAYDTSVLAPMTDGSGNPLISGGEGFDSGSFYSSRTRSGCQILWNHTGDVMAEGIVFRIRFTVAGQAAPGTYPVTLTYRAEDTINCEEEPIVFSCESGAIEVTGEPVPVYTLAPKEGGTELRLQLAVSGTGSFGVMIAGYNAAGRLVECRVTVASAAQLRDEISFILHDNSACEYRVMILDAAYAPVCGALNIPM